ncbi:MAG: DUF3465 domain-containing protein [Phycisphaerales bacterium]
MKPSYRQAAVSFGYKVAAVLVAAVITIAVQRGWLPSSVVNSPTANTPTSTSPASVPSSPSRSATRTIRELYNARASDAWVETSGRVEKLLTDDTDTSDNSDKHQKFLLLVPGDITVLVAHNISTAPRVPIKPGDTISLRGEYEYTEKGGTVHFTHKPKFASRNVQSGYIEFKGMRYQ